MRHLLFSVPLFLSGSIALTGCAYGPTTKASGLEKLNGAHYEGSDLVTTPYVPILKRRELNTKLSGTVSLDQNGIPTPVPRVKMILTRDGENLAECTSGQAGVVEFCIFS